MIQFLFLPFSTVFAAVFGALPDILNLGGKIVAFGLLLNLLLTPFYLQMERASQKARQDSGLMRAEIARMKRHFKGRELYFYIRTVHRQFGHNALTPLLNSGELLVHLVVFSSVFRFLVQMPALVGQSFGPIDDLSSPDRLLFGLPLLPVVMTVLNLLSVFVYTKKRAIGITMALGFLLLLYRSPSGLALYWTVNNLFSLTRNVLIKHSASYVPRPMAHWLRTLSLQE